MAHNGSAMIQAGVEQSVEKGETRSIIKALRRIKTVKFIPLWQGLTVSRYIGSSYE